MRLVGNRFGAPAALALAILAGLFPVAAARYALHNDWSFLLNLDPATPFMERYDEAVNVWAMGRPLGAVLLNLMAVSVGSLDDLTVVRVLSVALIIANGWIIMRLAPRLGVASPWAALALSAALALLPPFQLFAAWATNLGSGSLAVLLASALYAALERGWSTGRRGIWAAAAICGLVGLMAIYPPSALFGLTFTALRLVATGKAAHRAALRDLGIHAAAMGLYFILGKLLLVTPVTDQIGGDYSFALAGGLAAKAAYAAELVGLVLSLNLELVLPGPAPWLSLGLAAAGWAAVAILGPRPISPVLALTTAALALAALALTLAPPLAAKGNILGIRVLAAPQGVWLVILAGPLLRLPARAGAAALAALAAFQVATAHHNLRRTVANCEREYRVFVSALADGAPHSGITVMMRPRGEQLVAPPLPHEFGLLAVSQSHAVAALRAAMFETGSRYLNERIRVRVMGGDVPINVPRLKDSLSNPGELLINLNADDAKPI